jgi:GNAT superfamily N-acetyltransferase
MTPELGRPKLVLVETNVAVRLAHHGDIEQLVEMRSDFTFEDFEEVASETRSGYAEDCRSFLADAISTGRWQIWVAEVDGRLVSHAFLALIDKVPRPIRENARIAYLTNVYSRPDYRGQGIGAEIIRRAQAAAREADVELIIVWPSNESIDFYKREGFKKPDEPLIWKADDGD